MKITRRQLRKIIRESINNHLLIKERGYEEAILLETRKAKEWIEKQGLNKEKMMAFYNAGVKNIPDLKAMELEDPSNENLIKAIKLYYSGDFKELLKKIGITQLSDFRKQGYRFIGTMENLLDYDRYEDQKNVEKNLSADYDSAEKTPDGAIKIAQIGDWELLDAHIGEVSARCVVETSWCTADADTYDQYIKKDLKLYYLFNDKMEFPNNKLSIGIKNGEPQWGGRGGFSVDAKNDGIESYDQATNILGKDADKILKTLQAYYNKDMKSRGKSGSGLNDLVYIRSYPNFLRKAKSLKDSSRRIQFYDNLITFLRDEVPSSVRFAANLLPIFDYILKDKEMKNTKFLKDEKENIKSEIGFYLTFPRFLNKIPVKVPEYFDLIYNTMIEEFSDKNGNVDHYRVFKALAGITGRFQNEKLELHKNEVIEDLEDKKQNLLSMDKGDEVMNDVVQKTIDGIDEKIKKIEDIARIKELT